jgi:hypothetical protein
MSGADFAARGLALKTLSRLGSNDPGNGSALIGHRGSSANVVGRKLDEKVDDLLSVRDFGAKGDGVTDDTAAIRNAIHALSSRSSLFFGYRMGTGALYFPEGVYRITESGLLSDTGGFLQSGMTLRGAGKRNTILWLDPAAASADMWFYDNNDTSKMWGMVCEGITFAGGATWHEAHPFTGIGYGFSNVSQFSKGFKVSGPGWESGFVFNDCGFRYLETVFQCSGGNNADTHMFIDCEVMKAINVTVIDNNQSMNVTWIGCYLNEIYGDTLRYTANASGGGGNFLMMGGAVIAQTGAGASPKYIVRCTDGGPGLSSAPITFSSVRFELRGNWHGFANVASGETILTAHDCSFHNTGTINKNFVTVGLYCTVKFDGGSYSNGTGGGRFLFALDGAAGRTGKGAHLIFTDGFRFSNTLFADIAYTGNGGRLTIDETCCSTTSLDPTSDPFVVATACDVFGPDTLTGGGIAQNTRNRTVTRNSVNPFRSNAQLTGASGLTGTAVLLPMYVTLVEAWVKIPAGTGNGNNIRCLIGNDDKSVVYGQTIVGAQNAGQFLRVDLQQLRVENVTNTRRVRFWFDNGSGGNSSASSAGLVYGGVVYE